MATDASNTLKVQTMFAEEALDVLENELQLGSLVWRTLESEFSKQPNGYKIGESIKVKKPPMYSSSDGAAITAFDDTVEEEVTLTVDQRKKVAVQFGTQELTQDLTNFRERVVKPAVVPLSDEIDQALAGRHVDLFHAVGVAGTTMATFEDMQKVDTRFVQIAAPTKKRCVVFDPDNYAGLVSGAKSHFNEGIVRDSLKDNYLGRYSNVDTFRAIHVNNHEGGDWAGAPAIDGASQTGAILVVKDFTAAATVKQGDIFTIADVYDVNPVNKQAYKYLKQFVATADETASGGGAVGAFNISPAIVTTGAKQNVSAGPADGALMVINSGTDENAHIANFAITEQTFALACVPLVDAGGGAISTVVSSKSSGLSIRMVEYYAGDDDFTNTRMDILFGTATMYAETGMKVYG